MNQNVKVSKAPSRNVANGNGNSSPSVTKKNVMTCRRQHNLKFQSSQKNEIICNDCRHKISKNGGVYACSACLFYLCTICYRKKACGKGHPLTVHRVNKETTKCMECGFLVNKNTRIYSCRTCKYNLCVACYSLESCPGDHGLHLQMNKSKKSWCCNHCKRMFELNHSLFVCKECQYCLCSDCYRPMVILKQNTNKKTGNPSGLNSTTAKKKRTNQNPNDETEVKTASGVDQCDINDINESGISAEDDLDNSIDSLEDTPQELMRIPSIFTECVVCMEHEKNQLFQPCGHYICCESCSLKLMSTENNPSGGTCPVCNRKIEQCFRVING